MRKPDRLTVGRWHFIFEVRPIYESYDRGWRRMTFAIFRLNKMPPEGCRISREEFTGFYHELDFFMPFEFRRF